MREGEKGRERKDGVRGGGEGESTAQTVQPLGTHRSVRKRKGKKEERCD